MKHLIVILLLLLVGYVAKAQLPSSTFPSRVFNGNTKAQWVLLDSPVVNPILDTFYARYPGTQIVRIQGGDTAFWFYGGNRRWFRGLQAADTVSLSNRINLKLNISDTAAMLSPYLRAVDTSGKWVTSMYRKTASDSVFYVKAGVSVFGYKDSIGAGGSGLTSVGISMPSGFTVTNSPLTSNGTIAISGAGTTLQYIRGNGTLATFDTTAIPSFYLKVRGLLTGTSPITFNQTTGAIGINNANTSGTKGAASFTGAFSDNGSGLIDLLTIGSVGSCTNCNLSIDAKGRVTLYGNGTGPSGVAVDTMFRTPGIDSIYFTINGTQYAIKDSAGATGTVTSVSGTANRITITGTATDPIVNIAATYVGQTSITTLGTIATGVWNGTAIGATFGGTGQTTVTTGDLLIGTATNTWGKLAGVATGNALISGGVATAPSWGKIGLATHVSGNLPVTNLNSGTGASSSTFWRGDGTWATPASGSGTVIQVNTGYGLSGGPITTTGTLVADTSSSNGLATKYFVNKAGVTYPFESTYKTIYESSAWDGGTMAAEFTNVAGTSLALNGSYVRSTSSTASFDTYHRFLPLRPTLLPKWQYEEHFVIISSIAASVGHGPLLRSNNVNGANYGYASYLFINGSTTATPHLSKQDGSSDQTNGSFTVAQNDLIRMVMTFNDSVLTLTAQNITTSSSVVTITKNFVAGTAPYVPNTATLGFTNFGGTYEIRYVKFSSPAVSTPTLSVDADSKGQIVSTSFAGRFPSQLNANYPTVLQYSGGGDQLKDFIDKMTGGEVSMINAEQHWILLGSNDLRYGASLAMTMDRVKLIKNAFEGTSTRVYWSVIPEDSTAGGIGLTAFKNALVAETGSDYIDLWEPMSTLNVLDAIYNSGDGVHPNQAGQNVVYSLGVASGLLTVQSPNRRSPYQKFGGGITAIGDSLATVYKFERGANNVLRMDDSLNIKPSFIFHDASKLMISANLTAATHFTGALLDVDGAIAMGGPGAIFVFRDQANPSNYHFQYSNSNTFRFGYNGADHSYIDAAGKWKIGEDNGTTISSTFHIRKSRTAVNQGITGVGLALDTATYTFTPGGYTFFSHASVASPLITMASSGGFMDATTLYVGDAPRVGGSASNLRSWSLYIVGKTRLGTTDSVGTATGGYLFQDAATGEVKRTNVTGGITTLNTLTAATQTFATGTSGSDFNISSATSTHTFNIPSASTSNRGLVTTSTQTLGGEKTFANGIVVNNAAQGTAVVISGNRSVVVAPGVAGIGMQIAAFTYTSTAGAGTESGTQNFNLVGVPTLTSSNAISYTGDVATVRFSGAPIAAGSSTIDHPYNILAVDVSKFNGLALALNEQSGDATIASASGVNVYTGAGGNTFTLPLLATHPGKVLFIKNAGGGNLTVSRAGSDNIYDTSSVTSITIAAGAARMFMAGSAFWYAQ